MFQDGISQPGDTYGFVNEHEVRASTSLALFLGIYSFCAIVFWGAFDLPQIFIGLIWIDFALKVFFGPQYSLFGTLVRPFIKERYLVGAFQKRFAWSLGLVLSTFAFFCILIVSGFLPSFGIATETYDLVQSIPLLPFMAVPMTPPLMACVLCIIFMISESVFGYCVGCHFYSFLVRKGIMKTIPGQNCAGGVCSIK